MNRKLAAALTIVLVGMIGLSCRVQRVEAAETIYIRNDGSIDPPTAPISTSDNVTYTFAGSINDSIVVERDNIVVDGAGYTVQGIGSGKGIDLTNRSGVTVKNTKITGFDYGIWLSNSSSNMLSCNNASLNKWYGIFLQYSNGNTLFGNTASRNDNHGIYLYHSSCNTLSGNIALNNNIYGIDLYYSSNSFISSNDASNNNRGINLKYSNSIILYNNTVSNNTSGIELYSSNSSVLSRNKASNNLHSGIVLLYFANNTISGNNIINTWHGVWLLNSSNNRIYRNNFVDNENQVYDYSLFDPSYPPSINVWDNGYPSGGNYWSNYTGVDIDDDGIGDTAHTVDASNTDRYPLMGIFSDFDATLEQGVQTICNSSISGFQYDDSSIRFNVTGEDGTAGFCRICVPTDLMNATYRAFVNGTEVQHNLLPCSSNTHSYLYFTYSHSTKEIVIIPELASLIILPLFMIATLLAILVYRRKHVDRR